MKRRASKLGSKAKKAGAGLKRAGKSAKSKAGRGLSKLKEKGSADLTKNSQRAYDTAQKVWGIFAPTVMLIYVIPVALINIIIWMILLAQAMYRTMTITRFLPILVGVLAFGLLLLQANQDALIEIGNVTTACVDQIYAYFGKGIFDAFIQTIYPICTWVTYFVSVLKFVIRAVVDEYRCFYTCDPDACACDTCGGVQCTCNTCGDPCICDNDTPGCPTAGGFSVFLQDCCACFVTSFRDALIIAGFTPTEAVNLVQDLIDWFDIAPADPSLFNNFIADFPLPGEVQWIYNTSAKEAPTMRHYYDYGKSEADRLNWERQESDFTYFNVNDGFRVGSELRIGGFFPSKYVRSERWASLDENADPYAKINRGENRHPNCSLDASAYGETYPDNDDGGPQKRCIPENIIDILTAGNDGYEYLVFEVIAVQFVGPLFELFMEILLWFMRFIAIFFDVAWNETLSFMEDFPSNVQDMVISVFQEFTQEFLCTLMGWDLFTDCCLSLDFSGPVEFITTLLGSDCLGIDVSLFVDCFGSLADFTNCVDDIIATDTTIDPTLRSAPRRMVKSAQRMGHLSGEDNPMFKGGGGFSPGKGSMPVSTSSGTLTGSAGGSGFAPVKKARMFPTKYTPVANKVREVVDKEKKVDVAAERQDRLVQIYRTPILRAIHERATGIPMETAYPELKKRFFADEETVTPAFPMRVRTKSTTFSLFTDPQGFSIFKGITSLTGKSVSTLLDFVGNRLYESVERHVSSVGVGEASHFNQAPYSRETLDVVKEFSENKWRKKRESAISHMRRGDANALPEEYYWTNVTEIDGFHRLHMQRVELEEARLENEEYRLREQMERVDPWMRLTHGQKALRYTAEWVSAVKNMLTYPVWSDEMYDFYVPSEIDLRSEINSRHVGSSIVRSISHWLQYIKQSNAKADRDDGNTIDDRPAYYIEGVVVTKGIIWRFLAPWAMERLRDTLANRGPRWEAAAHRVLDSEIESYNKDQEERNNRVKDYIAGEEGATFQMPEMNAALVARWVLDKASYRTAALLHRHMISEALRNGDRERYIQLKAYEESIRGPDGTLKYKHRRAISPDIYQRDYENYMEKKKSNEEKAGVTGWAHRWVEWYQSHGRHIPHNKGVDPEVLEFFRDHNDRLARATTSEDAYRVFKTSTTRLPQLAAIGSILLPLIKNVRYIIAAAAPALTSPGAQQIYSLYMDFLNEYLGSIVREPIDSLVTPTFLLDFTTDFSLATLETFNFIITNYERTAICLAPQIVAQTILFFLAQFSVIIPYVGVAVSAFLGYMNTVGTFFLPLIAVCPPEVVLGEQNFLNFLFDTLDCSPTIVCTTADQCPGRAPCRCMPPRTQWISLFWQKNGDYDNDCPLDSGHCLCFWEGPCDQVAPPLTLNSAFNTDCSEFGYETDAKSVPWYPGNPQIFSSFGNFWGYIKLWVNSGLEWIRFITRSISRGYEPFFSISTFIAISGFGIALSITFGKPVYVVMVTVFLFSVAYGSPLLTTFIEDNLIPAIERVGNTFGFLSSVADFLLTFLRWDNYSDAEPLGGPSTNEGACFLINSGMGLLTSVIFVLGAITLTQLIRAGIFADILALFLYFILLVPRTIWRAYEFIVYVNGYQQTSDEIQDLQQNVFPGGMGGSGSYPISSEELFAPISIDEHQVTYDPLSEGLRRRNPTRESHQMYEEIFSGEDGSPKNTFNPYIARKARNVSEDLAFSRAWDWTRWSIHTHHLHPKIRSWLRISDNDVYDAYKMGELAHPYYDSLAERVARRNRRGWWTRNEERFTV
jgi:hypothetical protein